MKDIKLPNTVRGFLQMRFPKEIVKFEPEITNESSQTEDFDVLVGSPLETKQILDALSFFGTHCGYEVQIKNYGTVFKKNEIPIQVISITPNPNGYKITKMQPVHSIDG